MPEGTIVIFTQELEPTLIKSEVHINFCSENEVMGAIRELIIALKSKGVGTGQIFNNIRDLL